MKLISKIILPMVILPGLLVSSPTMASESPRMFTLSKYKGKVGDKIRIKGRDFGKRAGEVIFDHADSVRIKSWRKNKVEFYIPNVEAQNSYRVRVCKTNGECSKYQKFYVTRTGPEMHTLSEYNGVPGDSVRIKGLNFSSRNTKVLFGSHEVTPSKRTKKTIVFTIPDVTRGETYAVSVTDGANTSNAQNFFVRQ